MIRALGYNVEYAQGAFGPQYDSQEADVIIRYLQEPERMVPAIGVTIEGSTASHGVLLTLELFVIVRESDHATADVLEFLERFEERFSARRVNRQFRTIDGEPAH